MTKTVCLYEEVLSDGSKVYGVTLDGKKVLDCGTANDAHKLACYFENFALDVKYDNENILFFDDDYDDYYLG